jgi:alpha-methylacyl-CoA racemase
VLRAAPGAAERTGQGRRVVTDRVTASGPLTGVRILEVGGIGPGPFAAQMLSDLGADVVRVERAEAVRAGLRSSSTEVLLRGRRSIAVDLKDPAGVEVILRLCESADAMFETFRPGVAERLGIGPEACMARNPRLVYGRMTGWGQTGPYATTAGHDINYISLAGALFHFGRAGEPPAFPLCTLGDLGGGGLLLAYGLLAALFEAQRSGQGQVVDAAMVDGVSMFMGAFHGGRVAGTWDEEHRGANQLDSGAPYYDVYECADGEYISDGAIEPQVYARLLDALSLDPAELPAQDDKTAWPAMKERFATAFRAKRRDEWCALLEGTDTCFAPVLRMSEAVSHPHNVARQAFVEVAGVPQPAPAPRFSRTPGAVQGPPARPGEHTDEVLADWVGAGPDEAAALRVSGAIA